MRSFKLFPISLLFLAFAAESAIAGINPAPAPSASVRGTGVVSATGNAISLIPYFQDSAGSNKTFTLVAGGNANTTANNYYPFYRDGTAYATPANKKAYCKDFVGGGSTSFLLFQIVTSTASITFNQSTALTSPKYQCGADQRGCMALLATAANTWAPIPGSIVLGDGANATYVGFQSFTSAQSMQMQMTCYEAP